MTVLHATGFATLNVKHSIGCYFHDLIALIFFPTPGTGLLYIMCSDRGTTVDRRELESTKREEASLAAFSGDCGVRLGTLERIFVIGLYPVIKRLDLKTL